MGNHTDQVELVPNAGWDSRILVCRCGTLVDTFIVVTTRYVVIIDTLINSTTATALLAMAQPHLSGRQLLVVNTHADWDHAWGNHLFAAPGLAASIIATHACAERLRAPEARSKLADMQRSEPGRFDDVQLTPPTLLFDQRFTIDGGDLTLNLFATPGHTADHLAIYIPEITTLLAGDAAEVPFPFVESAASLPLLRDSLSRMVALNPSHALYCHAPSISSPTVMTRNIAYFDLIEERCRAALQRGIPTQLPAAADIEVLVNFTYAEAVLGYPNGLDDADFYRPGHQAALRAMLEYLKSRL